MDYREIYNQWLENPLVDEKTKTELLAIKDDEEEIKDRFYQSLSFGTAGLRGKLGAGTNRMNFYNVGRATQGIADFIAENGQEYKSRGVVIAYDCRHFSREFAEYAAGILAANGIKSYLFEALRPTPELAFTIRRRNTASGINITASHNPKEYNGYKVYWDDGAQVGASIADAMTEKINAVDMFTGVKSLTVQEGIEKGFITMLGEEDDEAYLSMVKSLTLFDGDDLDKTASIVYTPLNGAGSIPVQRILKERGFLNIHVVPEQEFPDPDFTTVGYPNPEDTRAFALAEKLGKEKNASLLIATDPDCDRLAIEVLGDDGEYVPFNGNQTGVILIQYILEALKSSGKMPAKPAMVKSIVTGEMGTAIGKAYGVPMFEALTGFKNICGRIPELETQGYTYVFGYEESIGYAASEQVRDKDGVSAAMLLCEAAAYYKKQGKTLLDVLHELYEQYGYYREEQVSLVLEGAEGAARIKRMMVEYRKNHIIDFDGNSVIEVIDYLNGHKDIPASDVLKFRLKDGSWYALRPSGTEPKIKLYLYSKADSEDKALKTIEVMKHMILERLESIE
jgi:phosphoglucomutase